MHTALFISPNAIHNLVEPHERGKPASFTDGLNFKTRFTKRVVILPNCVDVYRAGEKTIAAIEEHAHIKLSQVERLVITVNNSGTGVVEPLARHLPAERIIWVVCQCVYDKMKPVIQGLSKGSPNIIRAKNCQASDQMGSYVQDWLQSQNFGSAGNGVKRTSGPRAAEVASGSRR